MPDTPMMRQYRRAKESCGNALLLFRMGDFYELFHEDAHVAANVLGLALTSREKGENAVPMAGFPFHQLDAYLARLIEAGHRVALCDQVEDPRQAKGLVRREVTRIVTPGTLTEDTLVDPREGNYLAAVLEVPGRQGGRVGLAWVDLAAGRLRAADFPLDRLSDELARVAPAECLVPEDAPEIVGLPQGLFAVTRVPSRSFAPGAAWDLLCRQFQTATLAGFGFEDPSSPTVRAAGALVAYLADTQRASLEHIDLLEPYVDEDILQIDEASRRSLEISRTLREGKRDGSLLGVLDRTVTAMGARLLAEWLHHPWARRDKIEERLEAVAEFVDHASRIDALRDLLKEVVDLERILARAATGRASPRDLCQLGKTLALLPSIRENLAAASSPLLKQLCSNLDPCAETCQSLREALQDECPLSCREGGFIRPGHCAPLDALRELTTGGKKWLAHYQAEESQRSGIPSLKVGYNKVFGYYIEVTNAHRDKVPAHYVRKQTIKNAERYVTPELKEHEEQVVSAAQRAMALEYDLFAALRTAVQQQSRRILQTARVLAQLDVLASLASLAVARGYCRPRIEAEPVLRIIGGKHPVLDALMPPGQFVPNDASAGPEEGFVFLITGPNMAGKSTYIRQLALITLMAQIGSFVPAREATIGIADRVFARVGASDELARGQSTFMVEMTETARILRRATARSLVILDEVGRGTSTYDGVALAWAMVEFLHDRAGCRAFFATHYHELTALEADLPGLRNLNVAVREHGDGVVFLHQIQPGPADRSYGIHVARLAGVPREVTRRAECILARLEVSEEGGRPRGTPMRAAPGSRDAVQLLLFEPSEHPLLAEIRAMNPDGVTPLEALNRLHAWWDQLRTESRSRPLSHGTNP